MTPPLAKVDAALADWRVRIAAASRNVAELSELPEFAALKAAGRAGNGTAADARLVATVDELWQGVLLLGEALSRAEAARAAAARLWMPGDLDAVTQVLDGPSIGVRLGESPVLHRRLLGQITETAWVSPAQLLATMEAAFDSARLLLTRIATAREQHAALRATLSTSVQELAREGRPEAPDLAARLDGCTASDPLAALDELEALRPEIGAACAAMAAAQAAKAHAAQAMLEARARLARLADFQTQAARAVEQAAALVAGPAPSGPTAQACELPAWLDRLQRTLDAGRTEAAMAGLASWSVLAGQVATGWQGLMDQAAAALALRDDLRGRFGALQAKHQARGADPALAGVAAELRALLFGARADLPAARGLLNTYEATLARPSVGAG